MNVICMNEDAFYALIDTILERIKQRNDEKREWLTPKEAMTMLNIKSKTTLQRLRDEGKIEYSQIGRKLIQYNIHSLTAYLEEHKRKTF